MNDFSSLRGTKIGRRSFVAGITATSAITALGQQRDYGREAPPIRYPDPDIVFFYKRFPRYKICNTPFRRLHTVILWSEGPSWNGVGLYFVWSYIPNNI